MSGGSGSPKPAAPALVAGDKPKKQPYPIYLGGIAACVAGVATHPLDLARIRMQTSTSRSMYRVLASSVRVDGLVKGAYTGLSASLLRQMTYSMTRFAIYDLVREALSSGKESLPLWKLAVAASIGGGAGGLAGNPADVILVRMVGDINRPSGEQLQYRHAGDGLMQIIRKEGAFSLLRGLGPNMARAILMNTSQLATYDSFKDLLLSTGYFKDNLITHFSGGVMAGTVATTVCAPFDVLKSRIMNIAGKQSIAQVISQSFATEGLSWCFRGWLPAWIRLAPNTLIVFLTLEQLRKLVDYSRAVRQI